MVDQLSVARRSELMSRIGAKDTSPEIRARRFLHARGFRFRLHRRDLPGTPDIVLTKYRSIVFIHGCFWHRHEGCRRATMPETRREFWEAKFECNVQRDGDNVRKLRQEGWTVIVVWECETRTIEKLQIALRCLLDRRLPMRIPTTEFDL